MIARAFPLFILLILVPDTYLYMRIKRKWGMPWWCSVLWWAVTFALLTFTCWLALTPDFTPQPDTPLMTYLFVIGVFVVPKALYALCSWAGHRIGRRHRNRRKWGSWIGMVLGLFSIYVTVYGTFWGFGDFGVYNVDYESAALPKGFDGYRVAVFSDIHLGSFSGRKKHVIGELVDSINALHPDAVFFLGDIQNTRPEEIEEHVVQLSRLSAPDGVYSILGNHDYSKYISGRRSDRMAAEKKTRDLQAKMGWRLLRNEHVVLHRGADSIVVAGMEGNEEWNTDHGYGRPEIALDGVGEGAFSIMLLHNPKRWRQHILPDTDVQLTLSGHTHGGQVKVLGFSATSFGYTESEGMYERGGRHLYVNRGIGGLIPLRFNVKGEVTLITMHHR